MGDGALALGSKLPRPVLDPAWARNFGAAAIPVTVHDPLESHGPQYSAVAMTQRPRGEEAGRRTSNTGELVSHALGLMAGTCDGSDLRTSTLAAGDAALMATRERAGPRV
jgi:hypothetical protein